MNQFQQKRRSFLKGSAALIAGASAPIIVSTLAKAQDKPNPENAEAKKDELPGKGKAKHLILVSLVGGPPHTEMWDPKPSADEKYRSLLKTIGTKVDDIKFTEPYANLGKRAEDLLVINSMTSNEGNHDRARYLTHTSHAPNPTVKHPGIGSIVAKETGKKDFELPYFVSVGNSMDSGYLGAEYNPLIITNPSGGVANINYRPGDSSDRMKRRLKLRESVDKHFKKTTNKEMAEAQESMYDKAKRMMDSKKIEAFDLDKEKRESRDAYGRTNFGDGLLLARRLIDVGVPAVEVNLGGWDLHDDLVARGKPLMELVDRGLSQLIDELKASGKFDETIIACYGEFGRTPQVNGREGRDHFARAWSAILAGGPLARGKVIGKTDETGSRVAETPVTVPELMFTLAHCFGFDPLRKFEVNDRPIWYFDKQGSVRKELLA